MTDLGGRRVNRRPCTDAEEAANWSLIADVINQITTNNNIFPGGENQWPFVRFELVEAFGATTAGLSLDAKVLDDTGMDTGETIDVYDVEGRYGTAVAGDKGYGNIFGDTPVYEALVIGGGGGTSIDPDDVFGAITIIGGTYNPTTDELTITVTGADDYTVLCSGTDTTPQYLFDKIDSTCQATRDTNADALVKFQLDNSGAVDQNLISFLDASAITNYASIPDGADWPLVMQRASSTYTVKWQYPKVAVTSDDSIPSSLHEALNLNGAYVANEDALIASETVGSAGTNQKERLFLDVSIIAGWDDTVRQVLGHDANGDLHWYDVGAC